MADECFVVDHLTPCHSLESVRESEEQTVTTTVSVDPFGSSAELASEVADEESPDSVADDEAQKMEVDPAPDSEGKESLISLSLASSLTPRRQMGSMKNFSRQRSRSALHRSQAQATKQVPLRCIPSSFPLCQQSSRSQIRWNTSTVRSAATAKIVSYSLPAALGTGSFIIAV